MFSLSAMAFGQLDSTLKDFQFGGFNLQMKSGVQQVALPDNKLSNVTHMSLQVGTSFENGFLPVNVQGNLNYLNGTYLANCSGVSVNLNKSEFKRIKEKYKNARKQLEDLQVPDLIDSLQLPDSLLTPEFIDSIQSLLKMGRDLKLPSGIDSLLPGVGLPKLPDLKQRKDKVVMKGKSQIMDLKKKWDPVNAGRSWIKKRKMPAIFENLEDLKLGFGTLSIGELICKAMPYQGFYGEWSINKSSTIQIYSGITNRFPSLSQLVNSPILINSLNPSAGIVVPTNPADINLQSQLLIFNRDLLNLHKRSIFTGSTYKTTFSDQTELGVHYVYTRPFEGTDSVRGVNQLTGVYLKRNTQHYSLNIDLANNWTSGILPPTGSGDSVLSESRIVNSPLALALHVDSKVHISEHFSLLLAYRSLANNFYSPLQLINNNLINQLQLGGELKLFKGKVSSISSVSKGMVLMGNLEGGNRNLNQNLQINIREGFKIYAGYTSSIIARMEALSQNHILSGGFQFVPIKLTRLNIQSTYQYYNFSQAGYALQGIQNRFSRVGMEVNYRLKKQSALFLSQEGAFSPLTTYIQSRCGFGAPFKKILQIQSGLTSIVLNKAYWLNAFLGCRIVSKGRVQGNILAERTIVGNSAPIFNGQIQVSYVY